MAHRWQRRGDAPFDAASPWAIQQLAARLSQGTPLPAIAPPQRIYLWRKGVPTRRMANEEAVLTQLEPHAFVAVQSEQTSLGEQIALFRGATDIIAPTAPASPTCCMPAAAACWSCSRRAMA